MENLKDIAGHLAVPSASWLKDDLDFCGPWFRTLAAGFPSLPARGIFKPTHTLWREPQASMARRPGAVLSVSQVSHMPPTGNSHCCACLLFRSRQSPHGPRRWCHWADPLGGGEAGPRRRLLHERSLPRPKKRREVTNPCSSVEHGPTSHPRRASLLWGGLLVFLLCASCDCTIARRQWSNSWNWRTTCHLQPAAHQLGALGQGRLAAANLQIDLREVEMRAFVSAASGEDSVCVCEAVIGTCSH